MMDDTSRFGGQSSGEDDLIEIDLNFESMRRFQAEFSPNLSKDGLFIDTGEPLSPGSVVRFRVILPEEFIFLEGTAVVEWIRSAEAASDGAPGMALRFVTLSPQNQELVEQLVQDHIDAGGSAFDFDAPHAPVDFPTDALEGAPAPVHDTLDEGYRLTLRRSGPNIQAEALQALSDATARTDDSATEVDADDHVPTPEEAQGFAILSKTSVPLVEEELGKTVGDEVNGIADIDFGDEIETDVEEIAAAEIVNEAETEVEEVAAAEVVDEAETDVEEVAAAELEFGAEAPAAEVAEAEVESTARAFVDEISAAEFLHEAKALVKDEVADVEFETEAKDEGEEAIAPEVVGEPPALDWSAEMEPPAAPEQQPLDLALDQSDFAESPVIGADEVVEEVEVEAGDFAGSDAVDPIALPEEDDSDLTSDAALDAAFSLGTNSDVVEEPVEETEPAQPCETGDFPTPVEFDSGPEVIEDIESGGLGGPAFDVSLPEPDDGLDETPVLPDEGQGDVTVQAFDFDDEEPPRRRRLWPLGLAAVLVLAVAGGILWPRINAWNAGRSADSEQAPVIAAVEEPVENQDVPAETGSGTQSSENSDPSAEPSMEVEGGDAASMIETGAGEAALPPDAVTEPEPEPEPTSPPRVTELAKADAVTSIVVEPGPRGTLIRIRGNGSLEDGAISMEPLSSPPRVLIRIRGIQSQFRPYTIEGMTPELTTVRSGLHDERRPPELWVVVDLTGADVALDGVDIRRDVAELILARQ